MNFKEYFLIEKIVGNAGWVYHRTHFNPKSSEIAQKGIKPSINDSAMYGKGLYCCYDIWEQFKPKMHKYGEYILKGKVNLDRFAILDERVYKLANPRGNFEKHLKDIGTKIEEVKYHKPFTSVIAQQIWKRCKEKGYNGIVFTGQTDGKVAVIWNRRNFIPYQYALDHTGGVKFKNPESLEWKTLSPNISSIQRPYDAEHDQDEETLSAGRKLKKLSEQEEVEDLIIPINYGIVNLKNVKKCRNLRSNGPITLIAPKLEIVTGEIRTFMAKEVILPSLQECHNITAEKTKKIHLPKLKKAENIWAEEAIDIDLSSLERCWNLTLQTVPELNLPELKRSQGIFAYLITKINAPKLQTTGSIVANNLRELELPELKVADDIVVKKALTLKLPKLFQCDEIRAENVETLVIPDAIKAKLQF